MLINFLPLVHLVDSVPHYFLIAQLISAFIDKLYALQNGPPNGSQQILMLAILRSALVPSMIPFSGAITNLSISELTGGNPIYGGQDPSGSKICSSIYECSGKIERDLGCAYVMIGLTLTTALLETRH